MRRWLTVLAAAGTVAAVAAPAAQAAPRCSAPTSSPWHSCLSATHREVLGTDQVRLTRATPVLVLRLDACPQHLIRRTVKVRTRGGEEIGRRRVSGRCRKGVARYRANLRPDLDLPSGTVIQSFWSRLADEDRAPRVKLTA